MVNSKENMKSYFLPVYYVWAFISPTLILMFNNLPLARLPSFYALFGLVWPLTIVVYPAFYKSIQVNDYSFFIGSINFVYPLFFIAWLGPVVHLILAFIYHKKYLEKNNEKEISWSDYLFGFI